MDTSRQEKCFFLPKNIQEKIKKENILIVGCGGVGSILADLCVRGGFENISIIDSEVIEESNLQRQLYYREDIGKSKSSTLKKNLLKINENLKINSYIENLNKENIEKHCQKINIILDATDNIETRRIIDQYCKKNNKTWIYSGAVISESICVTITSEIDFDKIIGKETKNESCCEIGVLSSTTHITASMAYNNLLKLILSNKEKTITKFNSWNNLFFNIKLN